MKSNQKNRKPEKIWVISGNVATDRRGEVSFVNEFSFPGVKRFYQIRNASTDVIRGFHGHLKEAKYIYVSSGSILLAAVVLDDPESPNKKNPVFKIILKKSSLAYIPAGYANGFQSLEENTSVIVFSTSSLEESQKDDYRFPIDYWGNDVWEMPANI